MQAGLAAVLFATGAVLLVTACDRRTGQAPGRAETGAEPAGAVEPGLPEAELRALAGNLVFVSERDEHRAVYVMQPSGGTPRRLAWLAGADLYPGEASPDGRWLSMVSAAGETEASYEQALWVLDLDATAGKPRRLLSGRRIRNPAFDRHGQSLVVEADLASFSDLYRIPIEGGEPTRLTDADGGSFEPSVTPTGDLVFTSSRDGIAQIYRMKDDGQAATRLTTSGTEDLAPRVSPDGTRVLFTSSRDGRDRLYLMHIDGTGLRPLHEPWPEPGDELSPTWSPDGTQVAYLLRRADDTRLWVTEVATGARRPLSAPNHRDDQPVFSPDGRHVAFVSERDGNADLYVARADGSGVHRLTHHRAADWLPRWLPGPSKRAQSLLRSAGNSR